MLTIFDPKETSLDVGSMSKTPPNRRGITFEVGAQLEARDSLKNWYAATIEKIDYDDEKVLIHYRQWSHRYDEWFEWTSPYLRPVERVTLRRQGLSDDAPLPGFHVNEKVLASWSDCRFYPAKVLAVNKDASYTVKFYDGVIQTVKGIHVKPFVKEKGVNGVKSRSNGLRKASRERRHRENGGPKGKRSRRSTSDQEDEEEDDEEDSNSEEDRGQRGDRWERGEAAAAAADDEKEGKTDVELEGARAVKQEEEQEKEEGPQGGLQDEGKVAVLTNGVTPKEGVEEEKTTKEEWKEEEEKVKCSANGEVKEEDTDMEVSGATQRPEAVPVATAEQKLSGQSEDAPPPPVKPVRKQGFHNPNRFSREPLYRVIKNQPPPVLSINLDHNPFKCTAPSCSKSFRKAKLLHYHMKYYHGEEQPAPPEGEGGGGPGSPTRIPIHTRASERQGAPAVESPKRRRTISASMHPGGAAQSSRTDVKTAGRRTSAPPAVHSQQQQQQRPLLRDKFKENQLDRNGCPQQDKAAERSGFDLASKESPKQKDFLRIKLKKRRRRKKPQSVDEDSLSDWSTDSCGWSDDDFGIDLDVASPPLSGESVALDTSDQEIVRCVCEVEEENDFMIQCEECLCWQHGTCMGLMEENVPDRYACYICRDPPGQRQSLRYWYDREWLGSGHMYGLAVLQENYSQQNAKKIAATHQLLGDVQHAVEVLSGLQLKMSVLQSSTHPDLHLWRQPWKQAERPRRGYESTWSSCPGTGAAPSPAATVGAASADDEDMSRGEVLMSNALEKLGRAAAAGGCSSLASGSSSSASCSPYLSFQDSYISSEHCYQKPRAYYPAVEQRLVVETRQGSELEDSMRTTEDLLQRERRCGGLPELARVKAAAAAAGKTSNAHRWAQARQEGVMADGCRQHQQWQINLLDHIDAVQDEVSHRMDFIERELDVLESWLDYTGELEPPEPLARLPQLKHRMKQLLSELGKVQQMALCSST